MKIFARETFISILITIILIFILSLLISNTSMSEDFINPGIIIISSISIMVGAIRVSKSKKEKGIINGAILGGIYMLTMYLISSIVLKDFSIGIQSLIMIIGGIIGGVVGGIIGVNL
ncbi:MAG: TIGR04086 family membrane protein [Clostridia bacterium]|nr:TIGR04086 family membrane protein [Clostridia bacterium]